MIKIQQRKAMSSETKSLLRETYEQLIHFYDLAEELIDTVEHPTVENPVAQLDFIEPIVEHIEQAADVLTKEYRRFAETGALPDEDSKARIEMALANIYDVLERCNHLHELS
jgi:hypothetical protein